MKNYIKQTNEYITDNSIFRIGQVVEIIGQSVKVRVDTGKNTSFVLYKGEVIQNISVKGYIKIKKGFEEMIGIIEGESINVSKENDRSPYLSNKEKIHRILNVKILGFMDNGKFKRGIKELPLIDNTCYLLTKTEFNEIHRFVDNSDKPIEIGKLEYDDGQIIELGINKLFASHIGIFGNTGSGKSYTLAKIYRELFQIFKDSKNFQKNAKFFLIDFNGEYVGEMDKEKFRYKSRDVIVDRKYKNIYELTTRKNIKEIKEINKFPVHRDTLQDSTFWSIFLSATDKTQIPFLERAIRDTYISDKLNNDEDFKNLLISKIFDAVTEIDKKTEKSIITDLLNELYHYLDENDSIKGVEKYFRENYGIFAKEGKAVFKCGEKYSDNHIDFFKDDINKQVKNISNIGLEKFTPIKKIGLKIILKYFDEMIRGFSNREHLSPLIKRLDKRILDLEKVLTIKNDSNKGKIVDNANFTIVSLRDVNLDIRKMIPMLLVKELYDLKKKKKKQEKDHSLHIIIDEAHNILSRESGRENEQWKDYRLETFEEIIKEGRKFGTFLTIASQRPSDISPTIISQLHNYFLHRLINNNDLLAVEKTIAYLDKVSSDAIPNLATGTCILAGLIAQIPVTIKVNEIECKKNQPQSQNIDLISKWDDK